MAKKDFGNSLEKSNNINKGGGLGGLLKDKTKGNSPEVKPEVKTKVKPQVTPTKPEILPEVQPEKQTVEPIVIQQVVKIDKRKRATPKNYSTKSFNILNDDYDFIVKLQRHMRMKTGDDYTQNQALAEAMELLRFKYQDEL
jgi:hypothetical protein